MKIAITSESTVDLSNDLLAKFDIKVLPLYIRLGDEEYIDGEFEVSKIFDYVSKTKQLPKTSAVNAQLYHEFFEEILKNYDAIIHFALSSEISSTCSHAIEASKDFNNVFVIDSRSLSTGIALQCIYARKLSQDASLTPQQIYEKCLSRIPAVQTSFIINELHYLYKGGRCNSLAYFGSNILKIKPQIIMKNGSMVSHKKFMGTNQTTFIKYVQATLAEFNNPDLENVFITYTSCDPKIIEEIKTILKNNGFKNIYVTSAGSTITSYSGENCLGILYYNDGNTQN